MISLSCGHVALAGSSRGCVHLAGPAGANARHVRRLTGRGLDHDLVCTACDRAGRPVPLVEICEGCVASYAEAAGSGDLVGWRGRPGIPERAEPLDPTVRDWRLPDEIGAVADLAPLEPGDDSRWLLLTADGRIASVEPDRDRYAVLATADPLVEPDHREWNGRALRRRLYASPGGRYAAVVNDYGRTGQVIDLHRSGVTTMRLDSGSYHPETVPFSLAFAEYAGRPVVVHRTGWNALDVADPESGRALVERGAEPGRELDYFHGRLHVSPGSRWIADDGWVWAPAGVPMVWDLDRWLRDAPWEPVDGPSRHRLCQRWYRWDVGMCFVGDDLLAVSGIGYDDEAMLAGVRVFSAAGGHQVTEFAGPDGMLFSDGHRLYSAGPDGLHRWDPVTGELTGTVPDFAPTCYRRATDEFAAVTDGVLRRWRARPVGATI